MILAADVLLFDVMQHAAVLFCDSMVMFVVLICLMIVIITYEVELLIFH